MQRLWQWLRNNRNRAVLAFLAAGVPTVVAGGWQAFVYFDTEKPTDAAKICTKPSDKVSRDIEAQLIWGATKAKSAVRAGALKNAVAETTTVLYRKFPDVPKVTLQVYFLYYGCMEIYKSPDFDRDTKVAAVNTFVTFLIPLDNDSRLRADDTPATTTPAVARVGPAKLDGHWTGKYYYNGISSNLGKRNPVEFNAELVLDGDRVFGTVSEPLTFKYKPTTATRLLAYLRGEMTRGELVTFQKTYLGIGGAEHMIQYEGVWNKDSNSISGKWLSPNFRQWWGRFVMFKDPKPR